VSTYREIVGKKIKKVSSDPSSGLDGEMWYNSTSGSLKGLALSEAWSSAANMINGMELAAGFGTQTAALTAGGQNGPVKSTVEEYNGSGWASETALPGARGDIYGSFGTTTAGVVVGGYDAAPGAALSTTLEYNGSSWTSGGAVTARRSSGGAGIETAGLAFGGTTGNNPSPLLDSTQEYGGTSWTSGGAMGTARRALASAVSAPQTNALAFGGQTPSNTAATEEYNGTAWSGGSDFPSANYRLAGTGNGTAALGFGGDTPPGAMSAVAAKYDGTSWTTVPNMGTARRSLAAAGSQTAAVTFGGDANPPVTNATEEFNSSANVITAAAWASGPTSINTTSEQNAGTDGPSSAYAVWGGRTIPATSTDLCEEFNGTSFSAGGALNTAARTRCGGGTLTAAWCANGEQPAYLSNVEEYNGTSWTEVTDTPAASSLQGGAGPQTAGVAVAGQIPTGPYPRIALEYDGTNWTTGGATNTARTSSSAGMVGTSTNALITGGEPTPIANTETYDGSSWTEVADMVTALGQCTDGTFGTTSAAIQCGGKTSPSPGNAVTTAQIWNGTNWATSPNLGQARKSQSTSGSTTAGFIAKGQTAAIPTALTSSEEFTGETSALNVKTLTQS
jgi:hypothetical protein